MHKAILTFVLSTSLFLSGCLPVILGGAAAVGYMGQQERGAKEAVSDINIKTYIKDKLTGTYYKYLTQVEVSVLKGNVLLTGVVESPKSAAEVEGIVRSVKGVKSVYNQLFTDGIYPATTFSKDAWIVTQLKSFMFTEEGIHSTNYQVLVVNGHAYIFGLASDMAEREAVRHLARTTKGVVQVHSYISLYKGEPLVEEVPFLQRLPFMQPKVDSEEQVFE
tara:strand:+ start:140254 stop:140913 length:660 start_codon:yes stop_codon:yes gene_type:complete